MRKIVLLGVVALMLVDFATAAFAGGMGDPSTVIREKNAICEQQKRGIGPMQPNMCLPELPISPPPPPPARPK